MGTIKWIAFLFLLSTACGDSSTGDSNDETSPTDDAAEADWDDVQVEDSEDSRSDPNDVEPDSPIDRNDLTDGVDNSVLLEPVFVAGREGSADDHGALGGELSLAFDRRGALLVGDREFGELHLFSTENGRSTLEFVADISWASMATTESELGRISVSQSNTLFALSHSPDQIIALTPTDDLTAPYFSAEDALGASDLPSNPELLAIDSGNYLLVVGTDSDGIAIWILDGEPSSVHVLSAPRQSNTPLCLAVDEGGDRVVLCDGEDLALLSYIPEADGTSVAFDGSPGGVAIDQYGALYVTDSSSGSLQIVDPLTGAVAFQFHGAVESPFETPGDVLVSRERNLVVVADEGSHTVYGFSLEMLQAHAGLRELEVVAPRRGVSGSSVTYRIDLVDREEGRDWMTFESEATLVLRGPDETQTFQTILNHGVGSIHVPLNAEGTYEVEISAAGLLSSHSLEVVGADTATSLSGSLAGADLIWEEDEVIVLADDTTVPEGETLVVEQGVIVLLAAGVDLTVRGGIRVDGSARRPITFAAASSDEQWGVIDHPSSTGPVSYEFVHFSGGGDVATSGHCCGSMLLSSGGSLEVRNAMFTDSPSKGVFTNRSDVLMRNTVFERLAMGAELYGDVDLVGMTFASFDGRDDNDAIYVRRGDSQRIDSSVFVGGSDDGVDLLESNVVLSRLIIRDLADKAISVNGGSPEIRNCLILDNEIGIGVKDAIPEGPITVTISEVTVVNHSVAGLFVANKNGRSPDADIDVVLSESIIWESTDALRTDYEAEKISVTDCNLVSDLAVERSGVIETDPLFVDENGSDFRLHPLSPAGEEGTNGNLMGWSNQLESP